MTVIGIQQTNRRMCRYVFVMFIFLCWPQDVYVQGSPSVYCEAGKVTVGEKATITCIFPAGSITSGNSNFVVKKFTASNPRDGIDIMDCFHVAFSTSGIPKCIFPDMSLGYDFTFEPGNNRQTVVIPSTEHSDAGEYGCDRINHMVVRCNLTVTETTTAAPVTTAMTDSNAISTDKEDGSKPASDSDPGAIVGIVIGILVGVGLLVGAAFIVWRFKFREPTSMDTEPGQPMLGSPKTNDMAKQDGKERATDGENPSDPGKGGDRNSKDLTDASGKIPPTDNINGARDGDHKLLAPPTNDTAKPADEEDVKKTAKDDEKPLEPAVTHADFQQSHAPTRQPRQTKPHTR